MSVGSAADRDQCSAAYTSIAHVHQRGAGDAGKVDDGAVSAADRVQGHREEGVLKTVFRLLGDKDVGGRGGTERGSGGRMMIHQRVGR